MNGWVLFLLQGKASYVQQNYQKQRMNKIVILKYIVFLILFLKYKVLPTIYVEVVLQISRSYGSVDSNIVNVPLAIVCSKILE